MVAVAPAARQQPDPPPAMAAGERNIARLRWGARIPPTAPIRTLMTHVTLGTLGVALIPLAVIPLSPARWSMI